MNLFTLPSLSRKSVTLKVPPPTPCTIWRPPAFFPRLEEAQGINFDLETRETDWSRGPGWSRGKSSIVGVAVYAWFSDGTSINEYFPCGHTVEPEYNLPRELLLRWVKGWAENERIPKYNANITYDIGTLGDCNISVGGSIHDCQYAESLIDENALVNLDTLGHKYLGVGKDETQLDEWLKTAYGTTSHNNLYRTSPRLLAPYAMRDSWLAAQVMPLQWKIIESQGLSYLYQLEHDLIPLLVDMRRIGVRIDIPKAEMLHARLNREVEALEESIRKQVGFSIPATCPAKVMKRLFEEYLHIAPPFKWVSGERKETFDASHLREVKHPIIRQIEKLKTLNHLNNTFVRSYLLEGSTNGHIHCQFSPMRIDNGDGEGMGARTGRFSSSDPNLQNIPSRSALGNEIRQLFIPDEGHKSWKKGDYSQIEYRAFAHYAQGKGAEDLRNTYRNDPKTDYHRRTQKLVMDLTGVFIARKAEECTPESGTFTTKEVNFMMIYGGTVKKMESLTGLPAAQSRIVYDAYLEANPFVRTTQKAIQDEIQKTGICRTILGRITHFDLWEPLEYSEIRHIPIPLDLAIKKWGTQIKRANVHKAINYKLQGSAADTLKAGMRAAHKAGVFAVTGVPRLTVHDELDFSCPSAQDSHQQRAYAELAHIMETATPYRIPLLFEISEGSNWGDCK